MIMKKKILITGGNGYIGSILALRALKKYKVYIIDRERKNVFLRNSQIIFTKIDITNKGQTLKLIKKIQPDSIVHLAAQSTIDMIDKKRSSYIRDNIIGTKNIVDICKTLKIKKLIFSSTAAVYKAKNTFINENSLLKPSNIYGITKLNNEYYIKKQLHKNETKFCILRFFNVCSSDRKNKIGEYHSPETHLLPIIIDKILNKKKIYVYGNDYKTADGTCIRDYIHINDIVNAILKSLIYLNKGKSNTFNLGSKNGMSVLEIIKKCSKKLKTKAEIKYVNKRKGDTKKLICNINKANKYLNWKPKYSKIDRLINDEIWWFNFLKHKKIYRKFIY